MSDISNIFLSSTIYDEELNEDTILDLSSRELISVPEIENNFISVLYLQNNRLRTLPDKLFPSLVSLKWLDLRDNELIEIPKSVRNHPSLTHFLLQNNKITTLPNELGTVANLKVLQLNGNPLMYPPRDIIKEGTSAILKFLNDKFVEESLEEQKSIVSDRASPLACLDKLALAARSYNSVLDKVQPNKPLYIQFSDRDHDDEENLYSKNSDKCPKLAKSRTKTLPPYCQSAKYLGPVMALPKIVQEEKMRQSFLEDAAVKKQKELLAKRDKILQEKRNIEILKNWRKNYKNKQLTLSLQHNKYTITAKNYPYDTSPEYMTLLTRQDIEKDLPDKYRRRLDRRSKPTVPRRSNNDVHLAMKIKRLFENLEAIDLNRETMSPRTEQKMLLGEIQKISEIKQKLQELSTTNVRSVTAD